MTVEHSLCCSRQGWLCNVLLIEAQLHSKSHTDRSADFSTACFQVDSSVLSMLIYADASAIKLHVFPKSLTQHSYRSGANLTSTSDSDISCVLLHHNLNVKCNYMRITGEMRYCDKSFIRPDKTWDPEHWSWFKIRSNHSCKTNSNTSNNWLHYIIRFQTFSTLYHVLKYYITLFMDYMITNYL